MKRGRALRAWGWISPAPCPMKTIHGARGADMFVAEKTDRYEAGRTPS